MLGAKSAISGYRYHVLDFSTTMEIGNFEMSIYARSSPSVLLNREGWCLEAPEDSQEYENSGESSQSAWMAPCIFPLAL